MPKRILLVDDDPDLIEILKFELCSANYQVETAANGAEALKKLKDFTPNLIITDVTMPIMDGVDFFEVLKKDPGTERIPVLILSGSSNLEKYFRRLRIGDFISKPFDMEILHCKIKNLIDYDERLRAIKEGKSRAKIAIKDADHVIYITSGDKAQRLWSIILLILIMFGLVLAMIGPKMISKVSELISSTVR